MSTEKRLNTSLLLAQVLAAAIDPEGTPPRAPAFDRCPKCSRGKLVGSHGLRYCQRCAFTEKPMDTSKVTIITAIYGDYDELKPVLPQEGIDVDWVCVTDRPREAHGWRIVVRPKSDFHPNVAAKEAKCCPFRYTDNQRSIWVDASFRVTSPRFALEALGALSGERPIAQYAHPSRNCIYMEALACFDQPKYASVPILSQVAAYHLAGHPRDWGLWAGGVIVRRHEREVCAFGEVWLNQIYRWGFQDQISEPYVLRKCGLCPQVLPGNVFDGRWLSYGGSSRHDANVPQ